MCSTPNLPAPQAPPPPAPTIPQQTLQPQSLRRTPRATRGRNILTITGRARTRQKQSQLAAQRTAAAGSRRTALPRAPKLTAQPNLTVLPKSKNPLFASQTTINNGKLVRTNQRSLTALEPVPIPKGLHKRNRFGFLPVPTS